MARLAQGTVNHPAHQALERARSITHEQLTGHPTADAGTAPPPDPIRPHPQHHRQGEHQR